MEKMNNLDQIPILKKGGIHIKKKNRGKFTEYCGGKVTEECIARGKKSKDPKIRKRATFASNSRRWKHENGGILKAQGGTGNGFWSKLWNAVKEGGMAARDAKLGAIGAQQVRDLYSEGKNQEAQDLAKQYAKANTTGIALAGGAASTGLLGDLLVTGATTSADTFIDGDTENFGKNLVKNAAVDLIGHGAFGALKKIRFDDVLAKIKHPTWQKYYHGSPYPFDINNPYMGTGNDAGIHATKNYSVAEYFTEGSKDGVVYEFWAPKPSREFIDLHSNGLEMLIPHNYHKTDFELNRNFYDGTKDSKLLFNVLNNEGGKNTVKMIDVKKNKTFFSNPPEYYQPFDVTKDLTIDMGKIHWPDMPDDVRNKVLELNQQYPRYSKTKIRLSPEEWQQRAKINTEVSKLFAENGIPVVKYANTGWREGAGMSYMFFDPTKMRVVNLESPDILRPTTTAIGTGLGVEYGISQLKDE